MLRDCTNSQDLKNDKEYKCIILDETESDIPEPFIFPKFPMDIGLQLQKGEITARAYRELISGVSRAMLTFKRHPSQEDRRRVATQVVTKYPLLKTPGNNPIVSGVRWMCYCILCML